MKLIIFNPRELPELPRDKGDRKRKMVVNGSFRHIHREPIKGQQMTELENDTEVGKVSLYLDERELDQLRWELPGKI